MDAAGHASLDQWAHIFVFDGALVFAIAIERGAAIAHRLILQIAFAALIADRAIERMVDQKKFHHAFARFAGDRRIGVDLGGRAVAVGRNVANLQRAGCLGLGRTHPFHQTHAAIAGDRQALVIAEARNFGARHLARLKQSQRGIGLDFLAIDDEFGHWRYCPVKRVEGS